MIGETVTAIANSLLYEIIVVDDGSRIKPPGSKKQGPEYILIKTGVKLKPARGFLPVILLVFADADLKSTACLVDNLIKPVINNEADMAVAILPGPKRVVLVS